MPSGDTGDRPPRVIAAIGAAAPAEVALRLACAIAAQERLPLSVLLVEDADLLRAAALPMTREVGALTARRAPLEPATVERALAEALADLTRRMHRTAGPARIACTIGTARGRPLAEVLHRATAADIVLVSFAGWRMPGPEAASPTSALRMLLAADGTPRALDTGFVASALARPVQGSTHPAPDLPAALARLRPDLLAMSHAVLASVRGEIDDALRALGGLLLVSPGAAADAAGADRAV